MMTQTQFFSLSFRQTIRSLCFLYGAKRFLFGDYWFNNLTIHPKNMLKGMTQTKFFFRRRFAKLSWVSTFFLGAKSFLFEDYQFNRFAIHPKNMLGKVEAKNSCCVLFRWPRLKFLFHHRFVKPHRVLTFFLVAKRYLFGDYSFTSLAIHSKNKMKKIYAK